MNMILAILAAQPGVVADLSCLHFFPTMAEWGQWVEAKASRQARQAAKRYVRRSWKLIIANSLWHSALQEL
jgi:hypothetical protein